MIKRTYQVMSLFIDNKQPVTIEAESNASQYLDVPISDRDLLESLRVLEPGVVKAAWTEVPQVDELGLFRAAYMSDTGKPGDPPSSRYEWKEVKVWVVPSEVAK